MIKARSSEAERRGWQVTSPSAFHEAPLADAAPTPASAAARPPLTEVLRGLHSRELDTDSVFDQFFGPQLSGP